MRASRRSPAATGFTLIELMVVLSLLGLVVIVIMAVVFSSMRAKNATMHQVESLQAASSGLDMLARDLRSAGYGADVGGALAPQASIVYIDSIQVLLNSNQLPFPDTSAVRGAPLAYNPSGSPRPFPLIGTTYAPTKRYNTGAELIRWTFDLNNDGVVNAADLQADDALDARRTANPNDYVLVRQVYGDSTGNVAGANGGVRERIALVNVPGSGVPPLFTVYFKGNATPWNWSSGPVPVGQLANIERVTVQVTAPAAEKDANGKYAQTTLRTEVVTNRNLATLDTYYSVQGYVYSDLNKNRSRDTGEPGVGGALLTLGSTGIYTDASGYYLFSVVAGSYKLKHTAPVGYGVFSNPDSAIVTVGPSAAVSFADTARSGGFVKVTAFSDDNHDGLRQEGEAAWSGLKVTATPGPDVKYSDTNGKTTHFVPPGAYSVSVTLADSLSTTTPNPATGTMIQGDSASVSFGIRTTPSATIRGVVYRDVNRNAYHDLSETGVADVWVSATKDGGVTLSGSAVTNSSGEYVLTVPQNDPPRTSAYTVFITPPSGYFATTSTSISPIWAAAGQDLTGKDFGVAGFQVISLQAARVLSLASGDMVEKDWPTTQTGSRVKDTDLILGSDEAGTEEISVWFNKFDSTPLLDPAPSYVRTASASVLAVAVDTLEDGANLSRERADVVTGTNWNGAKNNIWIYINQSSSGNEGYLPTTPTRKKPTKDQGDVTVVLTADLSGGSTAADGVDILVGTASPTAGKGTIELWKNDNKGTPDFQQGDIYPPDGSIPNNTLGEVTAMALADFDGDGLRDLVVTTETLGAYTGQIMFLKNMGKTAGQIFKYQAVHTLSGDLPLTVAAMDIDGDGRQDVVVGSQRSEYDGSLMYYRNTSPSTFGFTKMVHFDAPGIVTSLKATDLGGNAGKDLAVGFRTSATGFGGGLRVYYTDAGTLLDNGVDPSGGAVVNYVPAIATGNFNYGAYPVPSSPPFLTDLAAGVKSSAETGALVVVIR